MNNRYVKTSIVSITAAFRRNKTILEDVYFTAPYKIMNPFYNKEDYMTIMCMSSASGIMAGDVQDFNFHIKEGAKFEFISQSYEKIHKMDSGMAKRQTTIQVDKNACFYYNPMPTQAFKNSAFESNVNVHLADTSSQFFMKEIITGGRTARGECFEYNFYHNLVNVYTKGNLVYRDNTQFNPAIMDLAGIGIHEGYTHLGNLLLFHCPKDDHWIHDARMLLDSTPNIDGGITRIANDSIVIRVLGTSGETLEKILEKIITLSY